MKRQSRLTASTKLTVSNCAMWYVYLTSSQHLLTESSSEKLYYAASRLLSTFYLLLSVGQADDD